VHAFSKLRNLKESFGHGSQGSRKAVIAGCRKKLHNPPLAHGGAKKSKSRRERTGKIEEKKCFPDETMTVL
jgi:hypothetical protein